MVPLHLSSKEISPTKRATLFDFISSSTHNFLPTHMNAIENEKLKSQVRDFWNQASCDTQHAQSEKFSRAYFDEIEHYRYFDQPYIHGFAQFSRYHGKKVLEVGFGAGTDFIQWLRVGARASGIDLTQEALNNLTHRIRVYNLPAPESIQVADAENLPFESNTFDLGYSFGVLHASPNTEKALSELVRVIRPGGEFKIMVYNRWSICAINTWVKHALLRGRPWKSVTWAVWNYVESIGMKIYTPKELTRMLSALPLKNIHIQTEITSADTVAASAFPPLNLFYRALIRLAGCRYPWKISDYKEKEKRQGKRPGERDSVQVSGNPLGWFHNISARKVE